MDEVHGVAHKSTKSCNDGTNAPAYHAFLTCFESHFASRWPPFPLASAVPELYPLGRTTRMETIATYLEARLEGRRTFTLHPDRVVVSITSISGEMDLSFPLATLSPVVSRLRLRSRCFTIGFLLLLPPWFISALVAVAFKNVTTEQLVILPFSFSFIGLIMTAISYRKVEYARFTTLAGIPALDIARAGEEAHKFDSFVDALTKQITISKNIT